MIKMGNTWALLFKIKPHKPQIEAVPNEKWLGRVILQPLFCNIIDIDFNFGEYEMVRYIFLFELCCDLRKKVELWLQRYRCSFYCSLKPGE